MKTMGLEAYAMMARRINRCLHEHGYARRLPEHPHVTYEYSYDPWYREKTVHFGDEEAEVEWEVLCESRTVLKLVDWHTYRIAFGPEAPQRREEARPRWSEERAGSVAQACLAAFLGHMPTYLRTAAVYYRQNSDDGKYWTGSWYVGWSRVDSRGRPFWEDGATIEFTEAFGLLGVGVCLSSTYRERDGVELIGKSDAIEKGAEHAKEIMSWEPARRRFNGYVLRGETKARLMIVNPNYIVNLRSLEELGNPGEKVGRLAYVLRFTATYGGKVAEGKARPVDGEVQVWIDAENGRFLGGDFR